MISIYTKDFAWEKWPKFWRFGIKKFQPVSYVNFQKVTNNIERFCFLSTFTSNKIFYSKIWLNYFLDDLPLWLHHKILKRNPGRVCAKVNLSNKYGPSICIGRWCICLSSLDPHQNWGNNMYIWGNALDTRLLSWLSNAGKGACDNETICWRIFIVIGKSSKW